MTMLDGSSRVEMTSREDLASVEAHARGLAALLDGRGLTANLKVLLVRASRLIREAALSAFLRWRYYWLQKEDGPGS